MTKIAKNYLNFLKNYSQQIINESVHTKKNIRVEIILFAENEKGVNRCHPHM